MFMSGQTIVFSYNVTTDDSHNKLIFDEDTRKVEADSTDLSQYP